MSVEDAKHVINLLETAVSIGIVLLDDEKKKLKQAKEVLEKENKKKK